MQRSQSRRSDISEAEADGLAEQEMEKLTTHLRLMALDSKTYCQNIQDLLNRQKAEIAQLKAEKEELMKDIRLAGSEQNQSMDLKNKDKLRTLMDEEDEYKQGIEEEKDSIKELDIQIKEMERTITKQRKNMGGVHMSQQKHVQTQKNKSKLESRLDLSEKQFNSLLTQNKKLREKIDHFRTEMSVFDKKEKKMIRNLKELKLKKGQLLEDATVAIEAREDALMKMVALKEKSEKDGGQFDIEQKELKRVIDHDKKLRDFMETKSEERSDLVEETTRQRKLESDKEKGEKVEETVESYEDAFRKIKEVTGIDDIDLLVTKFIEVEDKNFALFNYVNELNNDTEMLQEQIQENENEIKKFQSEDVKLEAMRHEILRDLEGNLEYTQEKKKQYEDQIKSTTKILEQLKEGEDSLFNKINCDRSAIEDMLGANAGVSDYNMIQYLGIIEQRTNELLQISAVQQAKESERSEAPVGLLGQGPQAVVVHTTIIPPSTGDDYDSDQSEEASDDETRPLTQQELKNKVLKGMSKREAVPKKTQHPGSASSAADKSPKKKKK